MRLRSRYRDLIVLTALAFSAAAAPAAAAAAEPYLGRARDPAADVARKDARLFGVPDPQPREAGETLADPIPIPLLPFEATGNSCAFLHDYDEVCPYGPTDSPDVVYRYSPTSDVFLSVSLCTSLYDTKVFVYENDTTTMIACNDDACGSDGFRSELIAVPLTAGNDYYVVVDGYGGDCGVYELAVAEVIVETVECPPGAALEDEPPCGDDYEDQFNGGCGSTPPVFSPLPCSPIGYPVYVCGETGGFEFNGLSYRDTDWYVVEAAVNAGGFEWCVVGDLGMIMGTITVAPCEDITGLDQWRELFPFELGCLTVPPGAQYLWVSSSDFGPSVGCFDYVMEMTGYDCPWVAVEARGWGEIKSLYR